MPSQQSSQPPRETPQPPAVGWGNSPREKPTSPRSKLAQACRTGRAGASDACGWIPQKLSPRGCSLALSHVGQCSNNSELVRSPAKGESEGCRGRPGPALTQGWRVVWDEAGAGDGGRMSHPNMQEGKEWRQRWLSPRQRQPDRALLLQGHPARFWERSEMVPQGDC